MGNLIPGQVLMYERVGDTTFARYRDPPHNKLPRWVVGKTNNNVIQYSDWIALSKLADEYPTLKKQLDNTLDLYYILKEKV